MGNVVFKKGKQKLEEGKVVFPEVKRGKLANAYPDISNLLDQPSGPIINVNPTICPSFSNVAPMHGWPAQQFDKGSTWGAEYYGDPLAM